MPTEVESSFSEEELAMTVSIDTAPTSSEHLPWCDLMFGGAACSCGAGIAGYPIYELG